MPAYALDRFDTPIDASSIPAADWEVFKQRPMGNFRMLCCKAPAVLKNSQLNTPFFSHLNDECAAAPETAWHIQGKAMVLDGMRKQGLSPGSEVPGRSGAEKWCADTWVQFEGRTIAIELQRSYQSLTEFRRRQARYVAGGVECYWLTRPEVFTTLAKSCAQYRMRTEFGNKFPVAGYLWPLLAELPVWSLEVGDEPRVYGAKKTTASVNEFLKAVLQRRCRWDDGVWLIGT